MKEKLESNLETYSGFIQEHVSFGMKILNWELEIERPKKSDAQLVPILFLRNILENADGVSILLKNSSVEPSKILARNIVETFIYLSHIFEKNFENRSLSYIYCKTLKKIDWFDKINHNTKKGEEFYCKIKKDQNLGEIPSMHKQEFNNFKKYSVDLIELPLYKAVADEFQRIKSTRKGIIPWHLLFDGSAKLEQLANTLNLNAVYEIWYRSLSTNTHSADTFSGAITSDMNGNALINPIRISKEAKSFTLLISTLLNLIFRKDLEARLKSKYIEFTEWYNYIRTKTKMLED